MALADKVQILIDHIQKHRNYLQVNAETLDIFNGNLKPYIEKVLKSSLSDNYFSKIKERIIPINVLKRITDKSSKVYVDKPERVTEDAYKDDIAYYEEAFKLNSLFQKADEYANMFKGYLLEPFLYEGKPKLRVIPYDRFLPYSDDPVDPTVPTVIVKFMGKIRSSDNQIRELFYAYSKDEFYAFTDDGKPYMPAMVENQGINPYGVIPLYYGNRGNDVLIPTQDTDQLSLTKIVPVILTDIGGAIMFQCFTIIYGIDVDAQNMTMSPNAFWSLKSDKASQKNPQLGTLKPEADIDKVVNYAMTIFSFWLETRGIKVGNVGQIQGSNLASGISKILDEMDTTDLVKKNMQAFADDERDGFWPMMKAVNNYWVSTGQLQQATKVWGDDFKVTTTFDDPEPQVDRLTEVETVALEEQSGYLDQKSAIMRLYPDLDPEQVDERIRLVNSERSTIVMPQQPQLPQAHVPQVPTNPQQNTNG